MTSISQETIKKLPENTQVEKNEDSDDLNIMVEGQFDDYSVSQIEENNLGFPNNKEQIDRVITLQSLFEIDLNGNDYDKVIRRISKNYSVESVNLEIILNNINKIKENKNKLDKKIHSLATEYPTFQIAVIDRNILRLGLIEIAESFHEKNITKSLVENFSKLAFIFGGENSDKFIKGVLKSFILEKSRSQKKE
ncbi:MAG: hypothetical protein CL764_03015 [Chloroflexi bacterium]|nr:hypothetical protein [Chloroflexota bacterium]|tara:strand:- start:431 stop:1012 length:582 start_codon:yes stop_codon:yes gene_type:complete